jgi:hypothetical protein
LGVEAASTYVFTSARHVCARTAVRKKLAELRSIEAVVRLCVFVDVQSVVGEERASFERLRGLLEVVTGVDAIDTKKRVASGGARVV